MTFLQELKPGITLLAPSYLHASIREELLKTRSGMLGLKLNTLQGWLQQQTASTVLPKHTALYLYKERIQTILPDLKIYQDVADSPVFLNECRGFLDSLCFWKIPLHELPQSSEAQKELFTILTQLSDIAVPSTQLHAALKNIRKHALKELYILDVCHTLEEERLIQQLVQQGATRIKPATYEPTVSFFHAVNKRQEIEACAQYIIDHDLDADTLHITLANTSYKPILAQIFQRYHIPYTLLQDSRSSIIPHRFSALFSYYLKPDTDSLRNVLDCGVFHIEQLQKLKDYLDVFACDIKEPFDHLQSITEQGHILDTVELTKLQKLEEDAEQVRRQVKELTDPLTQPDSLPALIQTVSTYVRESIAQDDSDTNILLHIETMLKELYPYINKKEDITFFLYFLDDISQSSAPSQRKGVIVSDLRQSPFCKEHQFLLGCTQKDYPAFQTKKGIFDENYHAFISTYPTMEQRYQFYLEQISAQLYAAPHIYVSYPLGTYEGKGMEAALEIEEFVRKLLHDPKAKSSPYPLYGSYEPVSTNITLSPAMAEALFVRDGNIHGSISALERYVKCPFSYFLRYGLSLREPMKVGFPDSYAGTLSHYLLETFTEEYGKEYTRVAEEKIEEILMKEITVMQDVFPSLEKKLENVAQRILTSMTQTLSLLDEYEQHSLLSPYQSEKEFHYQIPLNKKVNLALKGYIDRIDTSDEFLCILDYKSSAKTLSQTNVFAALQLQLLTYAIVCSKEFQKRVLGAFYVSLKNENIPYTAGKLSRRKPVTHMPSSKEEYEEVRYKSHRLNGWVMDHEIQALDDNGTHIVGVTQNKEGAVKARKLYELSSIERYFTQMYQLIGTRILNGDIRCMPMEEACMFCSYYEICRFKGIYAEKTQLVEVEDDIYQQAKGSDEDA